LNFPLTLRRIFVIISLDFHNPDKPALHLARLRLWQGGQCAKQARAGTKQEKALGIRILRIARIKKIMV
jgi:hypothetical protein